MTYLLKVRGLMLNENTLYPYHLNFVSFHFIKVIAEIGMFGGWGDTRGPGSRSDLWWMTGGRSGHGRYRLLPASASYPQLHKRKVLSLTPKLLKLFLNPATKAPFPSLATPQITIWFSPRILSLNCLDLKDKFHQDRL